MLSLEAIIADESEEDDEDDCLMYYLSKHKLPSSRKNWQDFNDFEFRRISRFEKSDFQRSAVTVLTEFNLLYLNLTFHAFRANYQCSLRVRAQRKRFSLFIANTEIFVHN